VASYNSSKFAVFFAVLPFFLMTPNLLTAQVSTAGELDRLLPSPRVSYGDAAWFVLQAADSGSFAQAAESQEAAFAFAQAQKWLPKAAHPGDHIKLGEVSLLMMRAFNVKGGFMYSLFHSTHHAYRELVYRKLIQGRQDPSVLISGEQFLHILSRILTYAGKEDAETPVIAQEEGGR
jgi:hypothetical protein